MLGIFFRYLEKLIFSCGLVISNCGFIKMTHVVKLMAMNHKSIGLVAHHTFFSPHSSSMRGIQISVWFLRCRNNFYNSIELFFQFRIVL